ncbi:MAG: class I SAM-dependent methyltransferase [Acidobacteria bacterium]|nr:class I SAM-dependent methyltransferase [Acidobacteriota bacterium]
MTSYLADNYNINDPNLASALDELSFWAAHFGILLFNNLEIKKNLNILDLGCGNGFPLFELAQTFGQTCQITAVDIWQAGLERAKFKQNVHKLNNLNILEANGECLPFPDSIFDLIVSNLLINNLANPNLTISECYRVLKPNGKIVLTTNVIGHFQEFYQVFDEILENSGNKLYLESLEKNITHRGSKEIFVNLLENNHFNVTKVIEDKFFMRFSDGTSLLNHSLIKVGFLGGWKNTVEVKDQEIIFNLLEHKLNKIADKLGELKMTVPMLYLEAKK